MTTPRKNWHPSELYGVVYDTLRSLELEVSTQGEGDQYGYTISMISSRLGLSTADASRVKNILEALLVEGRVQKLPGHSTYGAPGRNTRWRTKEFDPLYAIECRVHREWYCEGEAVGVHWHGICSPENPIHNPPCGWRS